MKKSPPTGRRGFIRKVALAAGIAETAAWPAQAPPAPKTQEGPGAPPPSPPPAPAALPAFSYPRVFRGRQLETIAFPLGGVGAGSLSLGGRGQLRDWEIFNRADKGRTVSYAFPAIWARAGAANPVVRVLEARIMPPYQTESGLSPAQMSGLPRMEDARFTGEFPLARIAFRDRKLPVRVTLEAFTPFIPLDADDSGLPVAVLRYRVVNPGAERASVSIVYSIDNPVGTDPRARGGDHTHRAELRKSAGIEGLLMTDQAAASDSPMAGSLVLAVLPGDGTVTALRGWPRAKWWASPLHFWDDFSAGGRLGPEAAKRNSVGSMCLSRDIAPGAEAEFTFLIAWHFPNRTPAWCGWWTRDGESDPNANIGNHYSQRFSGAWQAAEHTAANLPVLEKGMRQFLSAMRESTLPAPVKDAAMANLSTLVTPTCFRTADGKFRGFEGIYDDRGCCHGSCTHVWNYETSTQHLFPALARSMRESAFNLAGRLDGVMPIRLALPEGGQKGGITAADGTMGQIIKAYTDWQLSGDSEWLNKLWPEIKKTVEFCWVPGGWDADRDGVMEGVQHNTYDVEFYGPNPMCGVYYLGALRAAEEMGRAAGDAAFAAQCRDLFTRGSQWIDANLFNGQYYIQKVTGIPHDRIAKVLQSTGGAEDSEHPDFQLGEGCLADQLIGQYLADIAGLGPLLKPENIRATMASIWKYNYRPDLYEQESVQRIYALNDEPAVLICDYGKVPRPETPFPYFAEAWTGIEYLYATQLIYAGMTREGIQCFENVRRRYDGERRNPWDEPECGHHYARAMSAWSGILALSGFEYRGAQKAVTAAPRIRPSSFTSFWSTATGWGTFSTSQRNGRLRFSLAVLAGKLPCASVQLAGRAGAPASASAKVGSRTISCRLDRAAPQRLTFIFSEAVDLVPGEPLVLET
ncbi:MAG: hypothetical protein IT161_02675 [Bryobacterales bacterium]|nr:hypothetical protein [Bryobacterales bacterium]